MPKGNELPKKTNKELLNEITEKCKKRYLTRGYTGDANHARN
jgi:hypothetical protein